TLLVAVVFTYVLSNNPSLRQQILEPQQQKMQKEVDKGKLSQENYDRGVAMMESPTMFMAIGGGSAIVIVTVAIFGAPFALWLSVKLFLKVSVPYKKMLETYGLTSLVGILSAIITLLLMHLFDSVHASLGGALLVMNHFSQENIGHELLASLS